MCLIKHIYIYSNYWKLKYKLSPKSKYESCWTRIIFDQDLLSNSYNFTLHMVLESKLLIKESAAHGKSAPTAQMRLITL